MDLVHLGRSHRVRAVGVDVAINLDPAFALWKITDRARVDRLAETDKARQREEEQREQHPPQPAATFPPRTGRDLFGRLLCRCRSWWLGGWFGGGWLCFCAASRRWRRCSLRL